MIMKKNVFYLVVLMIVASISVSCTVQDDCSLQSHSSETKENQEMEQLVLALENYNANYLENNIETRGIASWLRRLVRVTFADAVGALCGATYGPYGAVAGGVFSSVCAYCLDANAEAEHRRANIERGVKMNALTDVVFESNIPMCTDSVGFFHNKIIMNLYSNGMLYMDKDNESLINEICYQADSLTLNENRPVSNEDFMKGLNLYRFIEAYPEMSSLETFEDYVKAYVNLYPGYEDELEILHDYISTLCGISPEQNTGLYITGALDIINKSQVNNTIKKRLGEAFITGYASSKLWNFE